MVMTPVRLQKLANGFKILLIPFCIDCVMIIKVSYDASFFLFCIAIFNRTFHHISCVGLFGKMIVNAFVFVSLLEVDGAFSVICSSCVWLF